MNKTKHFNRTAFPLSAKSMVSTLLLLIAMLMPQGAWAANHYDAGYESTATTYSAAGIKFKITAVRMYNYQGNNSQFRSNPLVTITAGGHTHTFYLGSLTSNTGKDTFYYNGEGNENPYKGSGSFSKRTYQQTVDGIPVKAYFDNQKNEQRVSTNPDKTYKDNGDGSSKWCTADLTIEIGVQTAAMVTIAGNWGDYSDGINKTESYSWPFDIPKHTCNSDIQSDTYRKSAATCTAAAVYYNSCSLCGAAQTSVFSYGSALGHGSTGYTESYSWTGNAYNDASQDTKACTFTLTCKKCSTKVVNGASLTCTKTAHVDASCTATGSTTYQATGSYTAANSNYNYSATKTNVYTVAALGHGSTGYTPTYTWGGRYDDATCTFKLDCGLCGVEVFNDNITTTKVDVNHVDATCGKDGNERWTATGSYSKTGDATYNGTAQTKDYAIPATGLHAFDDVTDPNHTLCTVCDHSFFRYTSSTKKAVDPYDANELKGANGAKLDFTNTYVDGQGVIEFKGTLKTIGYDAFYECSGFTGNLTIPNSVTSIGDYAFQECSGFTGLTIGNSVTSIGEYAFYRCFGFNGNLSIPNSVTSIGKKAFYGCFGFNGNLSIPNSVTSIGVSAFEGCSGFTGNLTIPNSVTSIGNSAFNGCEGFTGVEFQSVPQIGGSNTFLNVTSNKTVVLSDDSYVYTGENPYFPEVQSATYTRRGIKNQFGTLVLPFDVNGMGADYDLYKLDQVFDYELVLRKVDKGDNGGIVPAGTPVLIRLHDDLDGNYDLTLTAANTAVSCQLAEGSEADGYQLVGTYETTELSADDYFLSNNKFWNVGDMYPRAYGVKTAPFRAYLRSSNPYFAKALSINIADEDVTAVETLNAITEGNAEYYDMNGRRIPQLQKGINIVKYGNGKTVKVSIK